MVNLQWFSQVWQRVWVIFISKVSNSSNFNIDFETIMKIKTIMDALNTKKDDPRAKLLKSLKPYLKESRKNKIDQYIGLLNMSQVFELFKNSGGDENAGVK